MTSTLHYDNARIAQQLFNNEAKNLQALNDRLGVKGDLPRWLDQARG